MNKKNIIILFVVFLLFSPLQIFSQDMYGGSWGMKYVEDNLPEINITLDIGLPERNLLYPAKLSLKCNEFSSSYELLLVKKSGRRLSVSKNKYPITETPFSLGTWTVYLNGDFEFSKDLKGNHQLKLNRVVAKKYGIDMPDPKNFPSVQRATAARMSSFLKEAELTLKKISNNAWNDNIVKNIIQPGLSSTYFGIIDTIEVATKDGYIRFDNNKDNDITSITLNGSPLLDQIDSKKNRDPEYFILDTGVNIISFFSEDFGKTPPSSASITLEFGNQQKRLDFNYKENIAATFIVLKVLYRYDPEKEKNFEENNKYSKFSNHPGYDQSYITETKLQRTTTKLGEIITTSRDITLALWDDAIEDGDSISININGKWIAKGFPVKKKPQFLTVTLDPGPNNIIFVADNLGSIIPNTSILEIIDGNKRKAYNIETDMNQNNQVKIFYDFKR